MRDVWIGLEVNFLEKFFLYFWVFFIVLGNVYLGLKYK